MKRITVYALVAACISQTIVAIERQEENLNAQAAQHAQEPKLLGKPLSEMTKAERLKPALLSFACGVYASQALRITLMSQPAAAAGLVLFGSILLYPEFYKKNVHEAGSITAKGLQFVGNHAFYSAQHVAHNMPKYWDYAVKEFSECPSLQDAQLKFRGLSWENEPANK